MLAWRLSGPAAELWRPRASRSEGTSIQPLPLRRKAERRTGVAPPSARASDVTSTSSSSSPASRPRPLQPLDQTATPLLDAVLLRGSRTPREAPFHVPGHKRGAGIVKRGEQRGRRCHPLARLLGGDDEDGDHFTSVLRHDLTELSGLDLLSQPEGAILQAQRLAAEAWGVSQTRFLVNGSTGGIAAAVLACCRLWARRPRREREREVEEGSDDGDKDDENNLRLSRPLVLISRGAHRSAAAAAELAGADVFWIEEEEDEEGIEREREEGEEREREGPNDGRGGDDASPSSSSGFESRWGSEGLGRVATAAGIRRALQLALELDVATSDGGEKKKRKARVPAAVLVVSPSYFGLCADIPSLAAACCCSNGEKRIPLIVDQAHGAHFGLDARFPPCAAAAAASAAGEEGEASEGKQPPALPPVVLAVASAHKTLDALGQSALLHSSAGVPEELQREVDKALGMLQTSSPSYLLLASLDAARAAGVVVSVGGNSFNPWDEPLRAARAAAEAVRAVSGAQLLSDDEEMIKGKERDPLRLTVRLGGVGGRALAVALEEEPEEGDESSFGEAAATAAVEMATSKAVVLALGAGSTVEHAEALGRALRRVVAARGAKEWEGGVGGAESGSAGAAAAAVAAAALPSSLPPGGSPSFQTTELIPLSASRGRRLASELLAPYPPGVPLVLEGGELTSAAVAAAAEAWSGGSAVLGLSSSSFAEGEVEATGACRGEPFVRVFLR